MTFKILKGNINHIYAKISIILVKIIQKWAKTTNQKKNASKLFHRLERHIFLKIWIIQTRLWNITF
jgi:hypothetical protein